MKKIFAAIFALAIAAVPVSLFAAELSDEQIGNISANCASIKLQLQKIQKTDARSRVHLGAQFEKVATSLMMNLNLRLVKNNRTNADVANQQSAFANEREAFKSDYIAYSQELEALIAINCKEEPQRFYEKLESVRGRRQTVADHVSKLLEMTKEHRESVQELRDSMDDAEEKDE